MPNGSYFDAEESLKNLGGMKVNGRITLCKVLLNGETDKKRVVDYAKELKKRLGNNADNYRLLAGPLNDRGSSSFKWYALMAERIE